MTDILAPFAYLHGRPTATAKLKAHDEDFQVYEQLGYEFSGSGEHLMLRIRKRGENTAFVANELAKACGVKSKDVSWAGLKDRHALTEQWLSVHLPKGDTPDFGEFLRQYPHIQIVDVQRHHKKLRPGDLQGNRFVLTLTDVSDVAQVVERLENIVKLGVPNYFGAQRFGNQGNNLDEARRWGRDNVRTRNQNKRSLYLSTARSWIFNHIVSARIEQQLFNTVISGDILLKANDSVLVNVDQVTEYQTHYQNGDVAISAAMAGDNTLPTQDKALELEQPHLDAEPDLMALIRGNRMRHERRDIALKPEQLEWQVDGHSITLSFSLPSGCYATSITRELINEETVVREYSSLEKC